MRLIDWGEWEEGNLPGDIERDPYSSFKLVGEMAGETEADCSGAAAASAQKTDKENKSVRLTLCGCGCVNLGP